MGHVGLEQLHGGVARCIEATGQRLGLEKYERRPGEDEPLRLILCAEKSDERIELFASAQRGIRVSEYLPAALRELIIATRQTVAEGVNSALVLLYWLIGQRICTDILQAKQAEYGDQIFHALSGNLTAEFGRGFTKTNLFNMVRFAETFSDKLIAAELKKLREDDRLSPDLVLHDPYLLDFLGLQDTYAEKDLEAAILREIEAFILEIGVVFCFVARPDKSACRSMATTITSTCFFITSSCAGWWPSS